MLLPLSLLLLLLLLTNECHTAIAILLHIKAFARTTLHTSTVAVTSAAVTGATRAEERPLRKLTLLARVLLLISSTCSTIGQVNVVQAACMACQVEHGCCCQDCLQLPGDALSRRQNSTHCISACCCWNCWRCDELHTFEDGACSSVRSFASLQRATIAHMP
jgi:hypothetical protein